MYLGKVGRMVLSLAACGVLLAGCGGSAAPAPAASPAPAPAQSGAAPAPAPTQGGGSTFKVAFVAEGPVNDGGWTASALRALDEIKSKLGAETAYSEKVSQADQEQVIRTYGKQGFNVVFGHGFQYAEVMKKVAPDYPKTTFVVVNGDVTGPNLVSTNFKFGELGYFVGMTAGLMTKSNKVGVIGPMDAPPVVADVDTFKQGVQAVNPKAEVKVSYVGSWDDMQKAREAANAQLSQGIDVILNMGNGFSVAVFEACKQKNAYAIGWVDDQASMAPDVVLTSGIQAVPALYMQLAKMVKDGSIQGKIYNFGMKDGAQKVAPFGKMVPQDVQTKVNTAVSDYLSGKLQLSLKY